MFRLCLAGLAPHPDYLDGVLTPRQLAEWTAFDEIEPVGGPGDDYRAALVAMHAAAPTRKARGLDDFLIVWGGKDPLTPRDQVEKMMRVLGKASAHLKE